MQLLDRYIFKALSNQITARELESYLYQDHVLDKIDLDELIFDLVNINYRKVTWRDDLKRVVDEHFDETEVLVESLNFSCLVLIEIKDKTQIYEIIYRFSNLCIQHDYEYTSLLEFYQFNVRWSMVLDQVANEKLSEIIQDIKNFARKFNDVYNTTKDVEELLNISSDYSIHTSQEIQKEDIVDYLARKKVNFESTNKFKSILNIRYSKKEIKDIELDVIRSTKSKIKTRIPIYTLIGMPLFIAGYQGISKGNKGIVYVVFLLGLGLLVTVIIDIIQLIWYSKYK